MRKINLIFRFTFKLSFKRVCRVDKIIGRLSFNCLNSCP